MAATQRVNAMNTFLKKLKVLNPKLFELMSVMDPTEATKGFDYTVLEKVNLVSCEKGKALAELVVESEHANGMGTLHGGMSASLVDVISGFALFTHEKNVALKSVSVDMHLTYFGSAKVGETVQIIANTIKAGKNMAFAEVEIKNKATGILLVKGLHSKFLMS